VFGIDSNEELLDEDMRGLADRALVMRDGALISDACVPR
jgi:hypothetical protein